MTLRANNVSGLYCESVNKSQAEIDPNSATLIVQYNSDNAALTGRGTAQWRGRGAHISIQMPLHLKINFEAAALLKAVAAALTAHCRGRGAQRPRRRGAELNAEAATKAAALLTQTSHRDTAYIAQCTYSTMQLAAARNKIRVRHYVDKIQ